MLHKTFIRSVAVFVGIAFLIPLAGVHAIEYGGFGGRPANPDPNNPRTDSIFIYTLAPSETKEDGVRVINNSKDTKTFLVYATDSTPSSGGAFACKQLSEASEGVGSWIVLEKSEVTVESGKNEIVPFVVSLPESASVGEHNGCILVQEKKEGSTGSGVNLSVRTGLRVAITVPGDITRKLEIAGFTMTWKDDGSILLTPSVRNSGNVSIDANVAVSTKYFFGTELARHGGMYPILREETSEWNFELQKPFWGGWYSSVVELTYDDNSDAGIGSSGNAEPTTIQGPTLRFFSFPTPAALAIEIGVLCVLFILLGLLLLSMRRKRWIAHNWVAHKVTKSEDIQKLAQEHNVSWKLVAKVNGIKPPYTVHAGEVIKVPPAMKARMSKDN